MIYLKLELTTNTFCTLFVFMLLEMFLPATTTDDIASHIKNCCNGGKKLAKHQNNCENYEHDISTILPLWRGLCVSTYAVCCSREVEKMYCMSGRLAALTGSRCNEQYNVTSYSDCCRACLVGLAVKASGNICNDSLFNYFFDIESFRICCGETPDHNHKNIKSNANVKGIVNTTETNHEVERNSHENADGTIILDDDDICGKVPLCEQICENTEESYVCKCHPGYKLSDNMVTCTLISGESIHTKKFEALSSNDSSKAISLDEKGLDSKAESDLSSKTEGHVEDDLEADINKKTCPKGFKLDRTSLQCLDINECLLKTNKCRSHEKCINWSGGFRCVNNVSETCENGYMYNSESSKCEEIPSFGKGNFKIKMDHTTSIKIDSIKKQKRDKCSEGLELRNDKCVDINECESDVHTCDSNQICVNDIADFHCDCKIGFSLDTTTNACVDINECSINNHNCQPTQRCDNTIGSYVCTRLLSCGTGYTLNADSDTCVDDDECALNTHNCIIGWKCVNLKGSFRCLPKPITSMTSTTTTTPTTQRPSTTSIYNSYYPSHFYKYPPISHQSSFHQPYENFSPSSPYYHRKDFVPCKTGLERNHLGVCVDINECAPPKTPCGSHQRCINTNGSYRCQNHLKCQAGYKSNSKGTECVDIDECGTGEHNCVNNQMCSNRNGGYVCSCPTGHHLIRMPNGESRCVDINECDQKGLSLCPTNAQCINTIGSYFCECKSGFQKSTENERVCLDVDECNEIPGLCHQKCVNFFGGYRCTCNKGYELGPDNRTCIDVDECDIKQNHKLCIGFCDNVPGSYECSCPRGYILAGDRSTCLDIDECATGEFCTGRNDVCTNKRGGYKCTTIHCPFGYLNEAEQKTRCRLINNMCEGEDCFNKPSAYTYNFITFVSKMMVPPEGRTFFSLKGPAWYDNIEFDMKIVKTITAANIEKATHNHFRSTKNDHEVHLSLTRTLEGPQEIEIDITMTVFTRGLPRGKSVAKVLIIVSQYTF